MAQFDVKDFHVAYYKSGQPSIICSEFFDAFEDALTFSKTVRGKYLIMRKHLTTKDEFSWEIMPYGSYNDYRLGIQIIEWKWIIVILFITVMYMFIKIKTSS